MIGWLLKVTRKSCIARIMKDVLRTGQGGEEVGKRPTVELKWADLGALLLNVLFSCS